MKFKLLSDLHLEGTHWVPIEQETDKETTLLLAGDIHVGRQALPWIEKMCEQFYHVIYILGNHEFYHNEWHDIKEFWMQQNRFVDNFTFLDDTTVFIDGIRIIGTTLWTSVEHPKHDFNFLTWYGMQHMTDYRITKFNTRKLTPFDTRIAHENAVEFIKGELEHPFHGDTIVMTHHMPVNQCIMPQWEGDVLNAFFVSNLENIIKEYDIKVWCYGHTHDPADFKLHHTKFLCNPKGYGMEYKPWFNEELTFEV
jgi:predicted phosphodiesterase